MVAGRVLDDSVSQDRCQKKQPWSISRWEGIKANHDNLDKSPKRHNSNPTILSLKNKLLSLKDSKHGCSRSC
jgi:hypothetical protein